MEQDSELKKAPGCPPEINPLMI